MIRSLGEMVVGCAVVAGMLYALVGAIVGLFWPVVVIGWLS